ncbi:MAG: hypothetical protein Q4D54_06145 [Eubacteriales bacterium]|nr:hypothetical protein [Lachnospiraceae bacterium]MDO5127313.1 hypothetical protein [Eubacteriales bacterium]
MGIMNESIKKPKKVKVEYDVKDKKEKKKRGNNMSRIGKRNIIHYVILLVVEAIYYYFAVPSINIHRPGFWMWLAVTLVAICICSLDLSEKEIILLTRHQKNDNITPVAKYSFFAAIACVVIMVIGGIISSRVFMASKYANVIKIEDGDFNVDVPMSENVSNIALMDTDSARILGERAIGSLSDVVSQYEVSDNYSTIDYNGVPMKVASLEYAGFFKYMNNKSRGIPGYVLVDPVKNEAKYVELSKPIKYTPSAYFNHNLRRHVQMAYPTYEFNGYYFELDNEGNPYYVCPALKPNAGLFGAKDVYRVVICDPCTGDCTSYDVEDVPNWVDRVYDGNLACQKFNWSGMLSGGFVNSVIGNKGCKVTTDDFGYKVMDGDVWVYTGVTSVNGDQSNIGFILMNSRTAESKYFAIAGAEEHSAMSSAQGQVQHLGYVASFPSLINVDGVPTYIMVMKDNAGLVKMYAMVNVEKYNIVATAATQKEALASYRKLLAENGIIEGSASVSDDTPSKTIEVKEIRYITMDNATYVYITDTNKNVYKQNFADDETAIFIEEGSKLKVFYTEEDNNIKTLISFELL